MVFKEEYLITFCKEISDERVIRETSFLRAYDYGITHYTPYLESEIIENILILPNDKKDDYINLVIDRLSKTPCANLPENFIDKWLVRYDSDINEFPNFSNKELSDLLQKNYTGYYQEREEQDLIEDIQIDFFCYASMLEVKKMIDFLESKKTTLIKTKEDKKEDIYFRDSTSLDSKINRIIEKNFFLENQRLLNYGDFFEIDSEDQVQENGMNQSTVISSLLRNLESEIEDNLALMDKESGLIYLSKLHDKTKRFLENIKAQKKNIENDNYEDFFDLKKEEIEKRKDVIKVAVFLNNTKLSKLNKLLLIIESNLKYYTTKEDNALNKLKWIGGPSQLGFIISSLAELGYIDAPTKPNGDINYTQFARLVKETFEVDSTESTLSKYLNLESEKGQETLRKFKSKEFTIPHKKEVS